MNLHLRFGIAAEMPAGTCALFDKQGSCSRYWGADWPIKSSQKRLSTNPRKWRASTFQLVVSVLQPKCVSNLHKVQPSSTFFGRSGRSTFAAGSVCRLCRFGRSCPSKVNDFRWFGSLLRFWCEHTVSQSFVKPDMLLHWTLCCIPAEILELCSSSLVSLVSHICPPRICPHWKTGRSGLKPDVWPPYRFICIFRCFCCYFGGALITVIYFVLRDLWFCCDITSCSFVPATFLIQPLYPVRRGKLYSARSGKTNVNRNFTPHNFHTTQHNAELVATRGVNGYKKL